MTMLQQILIFDFIQTPNKCFFFKLSLSLFEISEYRHGYHVIPSSCSLENYRPQYPDFDEKITSELKYIFKADILFLNSRNDLHPLFLSWNTFCIYSCQVRGNFAYAKEGPFFTQLCCINSSSISSKLQQMLLFHTLSWKYLSKFMKRYHVIHPITMFVGKLS